MRGNRTRCCRRSVLGGLCLGALLLAACSGSVKDPRTAVKRMIKAYKGREKVAELTNYIGRGFMKRLAGGTAAESHPLDFFQKGKLFKYRITRLSRGRPVEVRITLYDGYEAYQWGYGVGRTDAPFWEFDVMKYRFPYVLTWVQECGIDGEIVTKPGDRDVCLLHYVYGDDLVTLEIDAKSWLLKSVTLGSASDSSFSYVERYGDYREVDGVPFPNRFSGFFKGRPYFENYISVIEYGVDLPDSIFAITVEDTLEVGRVVAASKKAALKKAEPEKTKPEKVEPE